MAESDFVKQELAKDVFMYTKRTDVDKEVPGYVGVKETRIEYAVECSAFRELDFTLKWGDGTQNLAWPEDPEAKSITVKCFPYERKPLVKLVQQGARIVARAAAHEFSPTTPTNRIDHTANCADLLQGWGLAIGSSWVEVRVCRAACAEGLPGIIDHHCKLHANCSDNLQRRSAMQNARRTPRASRKSCATPSTWTLVPMLPQLTI